MDLKPWVFTFIFLVIGWPSDAAELATVKLRTVPNMQSIDGRIEAINQSTVTALVNAKVKAVHVDVDDVVAANTLLVELDDSQLQATLEQAKASVDIAKASLTQAQLELKRLQSLKQSSYVSESLLNSAQATADKAQGQLQLYQAQVKATQEQLGYTKVTAPFSGVVVERHIEPGETALVGSPLLTGFALNQNRVVAHVPQRLISYVDQQKWVYIQTPNNGWQKIDNVTIAPSADPVSHTVMIRATISQTMLVARPGSFVKVAVQTGLKKGLFIPATAVVQQGDITAVFVQVGDRLMLRQIMTGSVQANEIEVLSGLNEGDKVALSGAEVLAGDRVSGQTLATPSDK